MLSLTKISFFVLLSMLAAGSMAMPSPALMDYCPKCGMKLKITDEKNRNIYVPLERRTKKTGGGGSGNAPTMINLPYVSKGSKGIKKGNLSPKGVPPMKAPVQPAPVAVVRPTSHAVATPPPTHTGGIKGDSKGAKKGANKGVSKRTKKAGASSKGSSSAKAPVQAPTPSPVATSPPTPPPSSPPTFPPTPPPTPVPSVAPTSKPSGKPSSLPSGKPSSLPSAKPSSVPTDTPSIFPSALPSMLPSNLPSKRPSDLPSMVPSDLPSLVPSDLPSMTPSSLPSESPSDEPTDAPSRTESITSALPDETPKTTSKAGVIVGGSFILLVLLGSAIALRGGAVEAAINGGDAPTPPAPANTELEDIALGD